MLCKSRSYHGAGPLFRPEEKWIGDLRVGLWEVGGSRLDFGFWYQIEWAVGFEKEVLKFGLELGMEER